MNYKKTKFIFLAIIFFGFFGLAQRSEAATYYVDQNHLSASDSNSGTEALPWKTMIYGVAQLTTGDTLLVKNGTYATTLGPSWEVPGMRPLNSGTEANPIVIKAYPGHKPIIDGKTLPYSINGHAAFGTYNVSYIIIDGFKVEYGAIFINQSSHITIQNCELAYGHSKPSDPSYTNMIEIRFTNYGIVRNCIIHGNKFVATSTAGNASTIVLHWANDTLIENNLFYDNVTAYINKLGDYDTWGNRNIFRYNIVKNCFRGVYMGGYAGASTDNQIIQNIFVNCETGVFNNGGNIRLIISNNVFYFDPGTNNAIGLAYFAPESSLFNGILNNGIFNNIFANLKLPMLEHSFETGWPPGIYCDYNCYFNFKGFDKYWKTLTYNEFKSSIGGNNYSIVNQDPKFVNPPYDFHLQANSPCKGTGKDGQNMGAYITGNETIGTDWTIPPDTTPPNAPQGLSVQ